MRSLSQGTIERPQSARRLTLIYITQQCYHYKSELKFKSVN